MLITYFTIETNFRQNMCSNVHFKVFVNLEDDMLGIFAAYINKLKLNDLISHLKKGGIHCSETLFKSCNHS